MSGPASGLRPYLCFGASLFLAATALAVVLLLPFLSR